MKKISSILLIAVATSFVIGACEKDTSQSTYNAYDSIFVSQAASSNLIEITLGQIAADSATDPAIKQYGAQMVTDHTAQQQQLQDIASRMGIGVVTTIDQAHQLLLDSLETLKGSSFDSVYIFSQVRDHDNTIRLFKHESGNGLHKEVKAYVYQTLPDIRTHFINATTLSMQF